jgi:hypothetical protein
MTGASDKEAITQIADYIWTKIQRGESGISRSMIADVVREAMGPVPVNPSSVDSNHAECLEGLYNVVLPVED